MSTSSVTSTSYWKTPTTTETSSTTGTNNLSDFDSFLQLLATELQYQDPTDPVSTSEYVSQMAQMSSLMQVQTISSSVEASQACGMIGKTVTYGVTDSTTGATSTATGLVQSVTMSDGTVYLNIDGNKIELSSVVTVSDSTTSTSA